MSQHADRMRQNTRRVLRQSFGNGYVSKARFPFWMRVFAFNHFETAWMYWDEGRRGESIKEMLLSLCWWPCFLNPDRLNEPPLFRLRSLMRFAAKSNPRKGRA